MGVRTYRQDISLLKALAGIGTIVFILYIITGTGFSLGLAGFSSLPWYIWVVFILLFIMWLTKKR